MGAIFALVVLSSLAVSGIYAKYITQEEASGVLSSPAFYFTSDILSEETPTSLVVNWATINITTARIPTAR